MSREDVARAEGLLGKAFNKEQWVANGGEIFMWMDITTLKAIYACGEEEFIRNARIGFSGQGFTTSDLRTMFHRIRFRVQKAEKAEVTLA